MFVVLIIKLSNIVQVGAVKQVPIVFVEAKICLHTFDGDNKSFHDIFCHVLVHCGKLVFHFVKCLNMLQVCYILFFLCLI